MDDEDYELLAAYRWIAMKGYRTYYACRHEHPEGKTKTILMHRVITNAPRGKDVDHVDGDGLRNIRSNLRMVTNAENQRNRQKHKHAKSHFRGVKFDNRGKRKWIAVISHNGYTQYLGAYHTPEEAARAWDKRATELWPNHARLNFPLGVEGK